MDEESDQNSTGDGDAPASPTPVGVGTRATGPGTQGWRAEKKERTRRILIDVSLDLFERHGYDATSVEEVAAAGGVSPRTVFRYFPAKHDLLFDDIGTAIEFLREAVAARPAEETTFEVVRGVAVNHARVMADPLMQRRVALIAANPSLRARALEARESLGMAIGEALADRNPGTDPAIQRLYGQIAAVALSRAIMIWMERGPDAGDLPTVTDEVFESLRGLAD